MTGAATEVSRLDRKVAPAKAPIAPGMPMRMTTFQSTFPNFQWDAPEASVVPISARCTVAEAAAGLVPMASRSVVDVTPYAMPSDPSTSWAPRPTRARRTSFRTGQAPESGNPTGQVGVSSNVLLWVNQ